MTKNWKRLPCYYDLDHRPNHTNNTENSTDIYWAPTTNHCAKDPKPSIALILTTPIGDISIPPPFYWCRNRCGESLRNQFTARQLVMTEQDWNPGRWAPESTCFTTVRTRNKVLQAALMKLIVNVLWNVMHVSSPIQKLNCSSYLYGAKGNPEGSLGDRSKWVNQKRNNKSLLTGSFFSCPTTSSLPQLMRALCHNQTLAFLILVKYLQSELFV